MLECKQCKFSTSFVADYRHHMYKEHNAKKPRFHRCERCLEKYYSFDDLALHRSNSDCAQVHISFDDSNNDNQQSSNPISDTLAKNGNNGVRKGTEEFPQLKLKRLSAEKIADYCKTVVSSKNLKKYFICSFCKGQYSQRSSLITHIRTLHEKLFLFKCSLCNDKKEFNGKILLNNHILYNHTNVRPFICSICGVSYAFKSVLISHIHSCLKKAPSGFTVVDLSKRASLNAYVTEEKIQVACPLCKAVCSNYIALIEHMKRHRNVQPTGKVRIAPPSPPLKSKRKTNHQQLYGCNLCSEVFADLRRLISHSRKTHNSTLTLTRGVGNVNPQLPPLNQQATEKSFICEVCSKAFSNLQKLVTHKRMSHGYVAAPKKSTKKSCASEIKSANDKLYECDLCSKAFSHLQKLVTHKRMTHKVSKPKSTKEDEKVISNGQKL